MTFNVMRRRFEDQGRSFLVRDFEDFYLCLLNYQEQILGASSSPQGAENDLTPVSISEHLIAFLEKMAETSRQQGEYAGHYFEEALFVMAALADEFFLHLSWEGRDYWRDHLLESRFFGTHDAGDIFFKNLDHFLRTRDPMRRDLAEVYLLALGLGFQGKYRNEQDGGKLQSYRHHLYVFIYHQEPSSGQGEGRLLPEAYNFTLEEGQVKYLQDTRQWAFIFSTVFGFLFILSVGVWKKVTFELEDVMERISQSSMSQR